MLLVPIFSQLGRKGEAARLIEAWWERLDEQGEGASERAIAQLRMHIELDFKPNPAQDVRAYLDEASHRSPDDDRVWLGRANLAIRTGEFDDARRWLDQCLTRRPDDAAVWAAYLNLGLAASRAPLVQQALSHLGTKAATGSQIDRLGAWLSAHRGDHRSERNELERLLGESPGDLPALDRLARLAEMASQPAEAQAFRTRAAEIKRLRARYEHLFDRNQPVRDAEEMADLAQRLGCVFEARGFLTVEIAEDPERADLRRKLAELRERSTVAPGRTLAEVVTPGVGESAPVDVATLALIILADLNGHTRPTTVERASCARVRNRGANDGEERFLLDLRAVSGIAWADGRSRECGGKLPIFGWERPTETSPLPPDCRCGAMAPAMTCCRKARSIPSWPRRSSSRREPTRSRSWGSTWDAVQPRR